MEDWSILPAIPACLNSAHWSTYYDALAQNSDSTDRISYLDSWIKADLEMSRLSSADNPFAWLDDAFSADVTGLSKAGAGFLGSSIAFRSDAFSLSAGNGQSLKTFEGLGQGAQKIA